MSVELSKGKELSRPDVMFGVRRRDATIKDFYIAIAGSAFTALWIIATVVMSYNLSDSAWEQASFPMILMCVMFSVMSLFSLASATDEPLDDQRREAHQKYRLWLEQELRPFLESKHGVKLTGDFLAGNLMAEKDENIFEVQLFGVQHVPSRVEENRTLWSHPVITGEVGLKRVDRPDAVSFSKI